MRNVWIMGMPRSGTSWLSQIFDSNEHVVFKLSPLFSYKFKNFANKDSSKKRFETLFELSMRTTDVFMDQQDKRESGAYPTFIKETATHFVIKDTRYHNLVETLLSHFPEIKIVYIVRNPCAAINSWLRAPKEFPKHLNPLHHWRTGGCRKTAPEEFWGFDDWVYLTKMYENLQSIKPKNVYIVRYEDLVKNPLMHIKELFKFTMLNLSTQTEVFLKRSQQSTHNNEYAVFKEKEVATKWKTQLDVRIRDEIQQELEGTELEKYLLD